MLKAVKVRLHPDERQVQLLKFQFGAARWAYNFALAWRRDAWTVRQEGVTLRQTLDRLVGLKRETETAWLKDADSQVPQQAVMHLDRAFQNFFRKRTRYPRFKSRHERQSISYPQRVRVVDCDRVRPPKVGDVRAVLHRPLPGALKTVTVSCSCTGKYFASLPLDDGMQIPSKDAELEENRVVGVDLGLKDVAVTDAGNKTGNPGFLRRGERNLRRKQRQMSRRMKGSRNRAKARLLVAKAPEKVAHARRDFQHKLSKSLIDENQAICVETLCVKNMSRNRKLARLIQDASWSRFDVMLGYKSEWYGRHLMHVDRWFPSSKTCSACGSTKGRLGLSDRVWECDGCGATHDRDVNAAINIKTEGIRIMKAEGLSVSACGGSHKAGTLPAAA